MSHVGAIGALPEHKIGDGVRYKDNQGREQFGVVLSIKAQWSAWPRKAGMTEPLITYCVSHPTYRNNKHYTGECFVAYSDAE